MKKITLVLILAMIITLMATACGNGGSSGSSGDGQDPITLTYMRDGAVREVAVTESAENRGFWHMVDQFEEANPHVTIEWDISYQADFHVKIMAMAAAENMPDIFNTKGSWVQTFFDNNLMSNLKNDIDVNLYREGIFAPFEREGGIYVLPTQFLITSVGYYNKALWADAGFDTFPDNWDDVFVAHDYFQSVGITTIAAGNLDAWWFGSCMMSALGNRFTGGDWTNSIILNDGKAAWTDPEMIETFRMSQRIAELFNPDFNAIPNGVADALFANGRAASTWEGSWTLNYFMEGEDVDPDVVANIGFMLLPQVPNQKGPPNAVSGGTGWGVSVNSQLEGAHRTAAVDLIKMITGREYAEFVMADAGMPTQVDVPVSDPAALHPLMAAYLEWAEGVYLVPIYDIQIDGEVIDIKNRLLMNLLAGDITPEHIAAEVQAAQDRLTFGPAGTGG